MRASSPPLACGKRVIPRLRQSDVAALMDTQQSVVSDLEGIGGNPTIRTIQHYARAVGCRVRLTADAGEAIAS